MFWNPIARIPRRVESLLTETKITVQFSHKLTDQELLSQELIFIYA